MKEAKFKLAATIIVVFVVSIFTLAFSQSGTGAPEQQKFVDVFLAGMHPIEFLAMSVWALIGMVVNILIDFIKRKRPSTDSPAKFSGSYWWKDNWRRLLTGLILIPVVIIGFNQFFGMEVSQVNAFFVGFGSDYLIEIAKRKNFIKGYALPKEAVEEKKDG